MYCSMNGIRSTPENAALSNEAVSLTPMLNLYALCSLIPKEHVNKLI